MNKKENKKTTAAIPRSEDLVAEAISRLGNKILFPKRLERARKYTRNLKMKTS
jgi:hypothetical protein